jgi:hypothetical protein
MEIQCEKKRIREEENFAGIVNKKENEHFLTTCLLGPMKILSWNCRGLSTPTAIPNLKNIAQGHQPDILFLSETLSRAQTMERVRVNLKYNACLSVDVEGRSGQLSVMWRNTIKCRVTIIMWRDTIM